MARWHMRQRDDTPSAGTGLAFLTVGLVAGLATGAYLAQRFGGVGGISGRLRRRLRGTALAPRGGAPDDHPEPAPSAELGDYDEEYEEYDDTDDLSRGDLADGDEGDEPLDDEYEDVDDVDAARHERDTDSFESANPELEDRVLAALTNDPVLGERAIDIGAPSTTTIELSGAVDSDEEYEHASAVTRGVPGVEAVVNRLIIRADRPTPTAAAPIAGAVSNDQDPAPAADSNAEHDRELEPPPRRQGGTKQNRRSRDEAAPT